MKLSLPIKILVTVSFFTLFSLSYLRFEKVSYAVDVSNINVALSPAVASVKAKDIITFTTTNFISKDGKILITYPLGFNVSSAELTSIQGFDGSQKLSVSKQTITITRTGSGNISVPGAKTITLDNITNSAVLSDNHTITLEIQDAKGKSLQGPSVSAAFSVVTQENGYSLDTNAPWPTNNHDLRNTSQASVQGPDYPTLKWTMTINVGYINDQPIIQGTDGTSYYNDTKYLYAISEDGSIKWSVPNAYDINNAVALTRNGTIYTMSQGSFITARSVVDGKLLWNYQSKVGNSGEHDTFNIAPDGTIIVPGSSGGYIVEGVAPNGSSKFLTRIGDRETTPAIDPITGTVYLTGDGGSGALNPDGTVKWISGCTDGTVGGIPILTPDRKTILRLGRTTGFSNNACNAAGGSTIWGITDPVPYGYSNGALSPDGTIWYLPRVVSSLTNAISLVAVRVSDGVSLWANSSAISSGYYKRIAVDSQGRIYAGTYSVYPNGITHWHLAGFDGSTVSLGKNNTVFYVPLGGTSIYAYGPWTMALSIDVPATNTSSTASSSEISNYQAVKFTVYSTMLQKDPASSFNNQIQVRLDNGRIIPLVYQSTTDGQSVWTGQYNVPVGTSNLTSLKGTVEAIAYNVTTDIPTHFDTTIPTGFNNTGIKLDFTASTVKQGTFLVTNTSSTFTSASTSGSNQSLIASFLGQANSYYQTAKSKILTLDTHLANFYSNFERAFTNTVQAIREKSLTIIK